MSPSVFRTKAPPVSAPPPHTLPARQHARASAKLQALARKWLARRRVARQRAKAVEEESRRQAAAAKLQALLRGRKARRERATRAKEKAKLEAYEKWRQEKKEEEAATRLQCLWRAHTARVELERRHAAKQARERLEHGSATTIQRHIRGVAARLSVPLLASTSVPAILINLGLAHPRLATRAAAFRSSYTRPRPSPGAHASLREPFQPWLAFVRAAKHHPVGSYLRHYGMPAREHVTGKPRRPATRRRSPVLLPATQLPWWWIPKARLRPRLCASPRPGSYAAASGITAPSHRMSAPSFAACGRLCTRNSRSGGAPRLQFSASTGATAAVP